MWDSKRAGLQLRWMALAIFLVGGYLTLLGESIHCQYFQDEHGHHRTSSHPLRDRMHCVAAGHNTAVAILAASLSHHTLQLVGILLTPKPVLSATEISFSKKARSPPSA